MNAAMEKRLLERKVSDADKRLAEIQAIGRTVAPASYKVQEIGCERVELTRIREVTARKLRALAAPTTENPHRRALIERLIAERQAQTTAFADKLVREGDFRQARIHRLAVLDIPGQVEAEF